MTSPLVPKDPLSKPIPESFSKVAVTQAARLPSQEAEVGKIRTLDSVDPIGRTEAMLYGPPGGGKTVTASTFPPPFRWIAADGDTSLKSIRWAYKAGITALKDLKDLQFYVPQEDYDKTGGGYPSTAKAFNRMTDMVDFWFQPEQVGQWQTMVLDSATELNEWALNHGLNVNRALPSREKPLSKSHDFNLKARARIVTGEQDYKSAMAMFEGFLNDLRVECARHGKNLVVICHEWRETVERESDGSEIILRYRPLLIGQLRERIVKSFDDVWHCTVSGNKAQVQVHEDPRILAKTRWGQVLNTLEEPDYRKLLEKVRKFHGL